MGGKLTPHFSRYGDWSNLTGERVETLKDYLDSIGRNIPVYLQEEARRGWNDMYPSADDFKTAASQARDSGAAAWVFHTSAGYELDDKSFFDALDSVEKEVIDELYEAVY